MKFTAFGCDDLTFGMIKSVAMKMGEECVNIVDEAKYVDAAASSRLLILNCDDLVDRWANFMGQLRIPGQSKTPCLLAAERRDCVGLTEILEMGDADFAFKPLCVIEVEMRIRTLLRQSYSRKLDFPFKPEPYYFDELNGLVSLHGKYITLQQKEFSLALFLFLNVNVLLTRDRLLEAVWTNSPIRESRSLDTLISKVRTKLSLNGENGFHLTSVHGVGYLLRADGQ